MAARKPWWTADKGKVHTRIAGVVERLTNASAPRWQAWIRYEQIYQDRYWQTAATSTTQKQRRLTINRARVLIETYTSKLLRARVLPMVVVKDGDTDLTFRARDTNLFIEGAFDDLGVYDQDPLWCTDLANKGIYFAHIYPNDGEPIVERVDPFEILLDDTDWQYADGRAIFRQRVFDRDVLVEMFPDAEDQILSAEGVPSDSPLVRSRGTNDLDQVLVTFAWHRRSGPKAKDGRYSVVLPNVTLEDTEEWDEDELPFAWGWRIRPERGMWGHPLMADLATPQETLDRWTRRIDESMRLMAVPRVLVRKGAKISIQKLDNEVGSVLQVENPATDIAPFNMDGISSQAFQYLQSIESEMQTLARTSLLSTQGQVPTGIKSGVAMRIMEETDAEGLREPMRYRDRFFVRIAKLLTRVFDQLDGFTTMARAKGQSGRMLNYHDVKLAEDQYRWAVTPTSFKARSASARVEQAQELVAQGLLPPDRVANFVDIPDLENETNLITAQYDAIRRRIDRILQDGDQEAAIPSSMLNLDMLRKMVGDAFARAEADGADPDRLELLTQLATEADRLQNPAPPPGAMPPGGPMPMPGPASPDMGGGMPGAPPMMPPGMPPGGGMPPMPGTAPPGGMPS